MQLQPLYDELATAHTAPLYEFAPPHGKTTAVILLATGYAPAYLHNTCMPSCVKAQVLHKAYCCLLAESCLGRQVESSSVGPAHKKKATACTIKGGALAAQQ